MTTAIQEYSRTEAAVADLKSRMKGIVYDVTTTKGMDVAKKDRAELRGLRTGLEEKRVELKAPILTQGRLLDAEAQRITAEIVALEDPIDAQIKAEEGRKEAERAAKAEADRKRIGRLQESIQAIRETPAQLVGYGSEELLPSIEGMYKPDMDDFAELKADAIAARDTTLAKLRQMFADAKAREDQAEAQKVEAARLKAAAEELALRTREQEERERQARLKIEKEEHAARVRIQKAQDEATVLRQAEERRIKEESDRVEAAGRQQRMEQENRERAEREAKDALRRAAEEAAAQRAKNEREAAERAIADERARAAKELEARAKAQDRLAAAAPALLAALHALCAIDDGDEPSLWKYADQFADGRAAINLATEEQTEGAAA